MQESPQRFAQLLSDGIRRARIVQNKSIQVLQDELGYALGREGGSAVEHWRKGHLPPRLADIEELARRLVHQGRLDGDWLQAFLESAAHPAPAALLAELTGSPATPPAASPSPPTHLPTPTGDPSSTGAAHMPAAHLPDPAPLPPHSVMPLSRNPLFVGRTEDLLAVAQALNGGRAAAVNQIRSSAATGMGGIGKTQLACEFVHRYGQFFAGGVFWLSFENGEAIAGQVAACGGTGGLDLRPDFHTLPLVEQVRHVQAAWQDPIPRLLVFDNCEDPALFARWRPTTGGCALLVTSRRGEWEPALDLTVLTLDVLPRAQSIALLHSHCPTAAPDILDRIAQELGDLPLALHLAGSYLYRYRRAVFPAQYLAQLEARAALAHPSLAGTGISPTGHAQHVADTFALSYARLDPTQPADELAQRLLHHMAHFAPGEPIWYATLVRTLELDPDDPNHALDAEAAFSRLIELGLIQVEGHTGMRIHRLVAAFAQEANRAQAHDAQRAVENTVYAALRQANAEGQPRTLLPGRVHMQSVIARAAQTDPVWGAQLCMAMGRHLALTGDYNGARHYYAQALTIRQTELGATHPDTAASHTDLGYILRDLGDMSGAQLHLETALAVRLAVLGEDHIDTADTLSELGTIYSMRGKSQDAAATFRRALAICARLPESDRPIAAEIANNLGICLIDNLEEPQQAEPYFQMALAVRRQKLGETHPYTALSYHNMGYLLEKLGKIEESAQMYRQALTIRQSVLGEKHPSTTHTQIMLGAILHQGGDTATAVELLNAALATSRDILGETHLITAACYSSLGRLHLDQAAAHAAVACYQAALAARTQIYAEENLSIARTRHELGLALHAMGEHAAAQAEFAQAAAIRARLLGSTHPTTQASAQYAERITNHLLSPKT
ncbi:MAG: tetratricopeptide repeat-containing protein [Litorilinea sp.]